MNSVTREYKEASWALVIVEVMQGISTHLQRPCFWYCCSILKASKSTAPCLLQRQGQLPFSRMENAAPGICQGVKYQGHTQVQCLECLRAKEAIRLIIMRCPPGSAMNGACHELRTPAAPPRTPPPRQGLLQQPDWAQLLEPAGWHWLSDSRASIYT